MPAIQPFFTNVALGCNKHVQNPRVLESFAKISIKRVEKEDCTCLEETYISYELEGIFVPVFAVAEYPEPSHSGDDD